jgi:DNA replication and repair protein RecF
MHFEGLQLNQFRNYSELQLAFSPDINCIVGPNGSGKTNILDALHYLAFTRGFRSNQDQHAVQEGTDFFFNQGTVATDGRKTDIACNFVKGKGKKVLVNRKALSKLSEHIGRIPLVAVLPHDTELIGGASAMRRGFLDMLISQYDGAFLRHLIQYNKILAQRNALLKQFNEHNNYDPEQLEIWDLQLIPHGMAVYQGRQDFLVEFRPIFEDFFVEIVAERGGEQPAIQYRSSIAENTEAGWQAAIAEKAERDRYNLYTSVGIHRDDLRFSINGQSVRNFGSQGQQKTFVIALKLAQYTLLEQHTQRPPVLLLDDIFDKLDEHRLNRIVHLMNERIGGQIFITDTSYERLAVAFDELGEREVRFFYVEDGIVNSES